MAKNCKLGAVRLKMANGGDLGQDPLAGQYGHAAIGATIDQGAAMDRKVLASNAPPPVDPAAAQAATDTNAAAAASRKSTAIGMLGAGNFNMPMPAIGLKNGGEIHAANGFFGSLRKAILPTDAEKAAKAQYLAETQQNPTQAPVPKAQGGISGYVGNTTLDKRMKEAGLKDGGELETGEGGDVPGEGKGDKIPAKYEPGEFVVSNAMLDAAPELRDYLHELRERVLAKKGMTPEEADEQSIEGDTIKAELGYVEDPRVKQIPTLGRIAPAPDGRSNGNDFTRNVNNSLNALGGMGVVASVPLKAAANVPSGLGAIQSSVRAAPMITNGVPGANFIAGANSVRQVGGANLPAVINNGAPVAKTVNVALQEGAKANQLAAGTRSLGNASAGLEMMDSRQAPVEQVPKIQGAAPAPAPMQPAPVVAAPLANQATQVEGPDGYLPGESVLGRAGRRIESAGSGFMSGMKALGKKMNLGAPGAATGMPFNSSAGAGRGVVPAGTPVGINEPPSAATTPATSQPVAPTGATTQPVAPVEGDSSAIAASEAQSRNASRNASQLKDEFSNASTLARNPGGAVRKTVDANGRTSYSGGNVTGDIALTGADGAPLPGRARGGLSIVGSGADTSALNNPDGTRWSAADNAIMAANLRDGVDKYRGTSRDPRNDPANQPMNRSQRAAFVQREQTAMQDKRYGQANAIAQEQLGMSRAEHTSKMAKDKQLSDAQAEYMSAPEGSPAQKAAERKLMTLGGKQPAAVRQMVVPGGQGFDANGTPYTMPSSVYDPDTKQFIQQGGSQGTQAKQPLDNHVAALKKNPQLAAQFDAQYGAGASAKYLGTQ